MSKVGSRVMGAAVSLLMVTKVPRREVVNCVVGFCRLDEKTGWMFSGQEV